MLGRIIAVVAAIAALTGVGASPTNLREELHAAASAYYADVVDLAPLVGRESAFDYLQRLYADNDVLGDSSQSYGYTPAEWKAYLANEATLDLSLVNQIMARRFRPLGTIRGLGETLVRSSVDDTMQPIAVYVPSSYRADRPAPLVVFLHGRPQSETDLLSPPFVAALAERTGSILIAPYGRGEYDFRKTAADVYDALDAATIAFAVDRRRRFLVGYSMGGFSVYEVAPIHPDDWDAVMSIAGGLLGHDALPVVSTMSQKPFYVLTGSADQSIPTQYPTSTAAFLQSRGMPVSFYSQPGGLHRLITLLPVLMQAWDDMHGGIVRASPPMLGQVPLPLTAPSGTLEKQ
jgi:predicted esterase